jgi:phage shock protein PspC (stress-responsive transcriptional regulator)
VGTSKIVKHLFGSTDSSFLIVSIIIFLVFTVFLLVVPILVVILAIVLVVKLLRRNKGNDNEPDYIFNNDINMTENKKLYRSNDRVIAGVCGGLANYFGFDPTVIRVVFALLTLFTAFSGVLIYFILWLLMPSRK